MYQKFFGLKYLIQFLKMTPAPNFGFFIQILLVFLKNFDIIGYTCWSKFISY